MYSIEYNSFPGRPCTGIRYGIYKIMEVWKGDYKDNTIRVDYKKTNEKYFPSGGCVIMYPPDGRLNFQPELNEIVVLFLEDDSSIYIGRQGKVAVEDSTIESYRDAVANAVRLDRLSEDDRVDMIFEDLEDKNLFIRASMQREFIEIDKEKYGPKIAQLLNKNDSSIKQLALFTLNGTRDTSLISFIIPLLNDTSAYVRRSAADVLRRIPDERAIPPLIKSYGDPDPIVRRNVIFALSSKYFKVREKYKDQFAPLYYDAVEDTNVQVRRMGVHALGTIDEQRAAIFLLDALKDDSASVRHTALLALRYHLSPNIVLPVSRLLYSDDRLVLSSALTCIIRLAGRNYIEAENNKDIIQRLKHIIEFNDYDMNRSQAVRALAKIDDSAFREMLPDLLIDGEYSVKYSAIDVMWQSKDKGYIPYLEKALDEETDKNIIDRIEYALDKLKVK